MRLIDGDRLRDSFLMVCTGGGRLGEISQKIIEWAVSMVDDMPTEYRWVSCSERLPEKPKPNPDLDGKPLDLYLVCAKGDTPFRAFWNGETFTDGWFCLTHEVDAWMPLPEPYKKGERK